MGKHNSSLNQDSADLPSTAHLSKRQHQASGTKSETRRGKLAWPR